MKLIQIRYIQIGYIQFRVKIGGFRVNRTRGRNSSNRAPARQTTRSNFFSGRNNDPAPARQTTRSNFFSGRNNDPAPARQTTRTFFRS